MISIQDKPKKLKIKKVLKSFVDSIVRHPYKILVVVLIFWFLQWLWGFEASFFVTLFFLFLLLRWEPRILFAFGLLFLVTCPFFLIADKESRAEQMAIYTYYLLFIGTVLSLVEYIREERKKKQKKNE